MAEGTRLARVEEASKVNCENIAALQTGQIEAQRQILENQARLGSVEESLTEVKSMLQRLLDKQPEINDTGKHSTDGSSNRQQTNQHLNTNLSHQWHKSIKVEIPMFDGEGVEEWVFKVHEYFDIYDVSTEMRLRVISFHLCGAAYTWYRLGVDNGIRYTWEAFLDALLVRFGNNTFFDPKATLKELKQTQSVAEYQFQFEELSNQVTGLNEEWLVALFVAGLQEHLKCELRMAQPKSYVQAVSIAKLHEQKHAALQQVPRYVVPKTGAGNDIKVVGGASFGGKGVGTRSYSTNFRTQNSHSGQQAVSSQASNSGGGANVGAGNSGIKHLTAAEIRQRREKGLCYYCDERYTPTHKCKTSSLLLMGDEDMEELWPREPPEEEQQVEEMNEEPVEKLPGISFNAMAGQYLPSTIRVQVQCMGKPLILLVDGGSTHNFIKTSAANGLGLTMQEIAPFRVYVGSGDSILCSYRCNQLPIQVQRYSFVVDFFVLDMQGADMVLGVQWLETLGFVRTHYKDLTMEFTVGGQQVLLKGERAMKHDPISCKTLQKMVRSEEVSSFYQLCVLDPGKDHEQQQGDSDPDVSACLDRHAAVFEEPKELPPYRDIDHSIYLLPGAKPVSVRPYKYPHFQKGEIERMVEEMMAAGIIRDSQSTFSSPILLVK